MMHTALSIISSRILPWKRYCADDYISNETFKIFPYFTEQSVLSQKHNKQNKTSVVVMLIFLKWAITGLFSFIFVLFKQFYRIKTAYSEGFELERSD